MLEVSRNKAPQNESKVDSATDPRPGGQRVWAGGKGTAPGLAPPRKNTSPENLVILRGDALFSFKTWGENEQLKLRQFSEPTGKETIKFRKIKKLYNKYDVITVDYMIWLKIAFP